MKTIAEAGFKFVEAYSFETDSRLHPDVVFFDQVLTDLRRFGLKLSGLNISDIIVGCNLTGIKREISYAASLGLASVNIRGGLRTERDMNALVNCMKVLTPYAQTHGISINIRNYHGNRIETLDDVETILASVRQPNVGLALDVAQLRSSHVDPLDAVERFADRMHVIYVREPARPAGAAKEHDAAAGLLGKLIEKDYRGFIVIEAETRGKAVVRHLQEARQYLEGVLQGKLSAGSPAAGTSAAASTERTP